MAKNGKSSTEDRDQQIIRRLANIEHRVDSLDQTSAFALRADAEKHMETVKKIFGKSKRRVQIYLAANGERSVQEIADMLGVKMPNVSPELKLLRDEGLLGVVEKEGSAVFWGKKPVDRTLRISQYLMGKFSFDKDGLPVE